MKINYSKTFSFRVTRKKKPLNFQYSVGNICIDHCNEIKYLGLTITSNLKWEKHISNICAKAFKKLCFLRRKLSKSPTSVKLTAYKTLIRPTLEYASVVWDPHYRKDISSLELIQRRAARFIIGDYRHSSSVTTMLQKLDLETLEERRKIIRLKFFYLIYNEQTGLDRNTYLMPPPQRSSRINHSKTVKPFWPKNDVFKFSFFVRTSEEWNLLSSTCVNCSSIAEFEKCLKQAM